MSTFFALYTAAAMKLAACGFWLQLDRFFSVVGKGSLMILTSWHCLQTHASIFFPSVLHRLSLSLYIYMLIDAYEVTAIYIYGMHILFVVEVANLEEQCIIIHHAGPSCCQSVPRSSLAQVFSMPGIRRNIWQVRSKFQAKSKGRESG